MAIDPTKVPVSRFGHGSRVPGWDDAADLTKDPRSSPTPRHTPVPDELRAEIEAHMAQYPDRRSAAIPALHAVQREHGWCSPTAIEQAAARDAPDARLPDRGGDVLRHVRDARRRAATTSTSARTSRARCAAPTRSTRRCMSAVGDDPEFHVRAFECLGACDIAPMASVDGEYVGPLERDDCRTDRRRPSRPAARGAAGQAAPPRARPTETLEMPEGPAERPLSVQGHRRARPQHARRSTSAAAATRCCARRSRWSREDVLQRDARVRASAAAAAPASRWARRRPSSPRARWTSTSSATPTSPSPGTFKDRELMQKNPHQLIEGMIIAAYAVGATRRSSSSAASTSTRPTSSTPRSPRRARRATSASASSAPTTRSTSWCTAAPAPTSAARRPRCSTRSRASAATRA